MIKKDAHSGLRYEGEVAEMVEIGSSTVRLFTCADVKPARSAFVGTLDERCCVADQ